jgi:hypothetical protein
MQIMTGNSEIICFCEKTPQFYGPFHYSLASLVKVIELLKVSERERAWS